MPGSSSAGSRPAGQRLHVITLLVILLIGLWLRWWLNGVWRLGPDEALYASWARRVADGSDVWLANTAGVDKPPLFIYAMALAMTIYGYTEFATRFPSIVAGSISVLLTYVLARDLYRRRQLALLAALLVALSPFAILYAPTAYPDPMMVMWLLLGAILALHRRWVVAGFVVALAVLTKQEALVLLPVPLILSCPVARQALPGGDSRRRILQYLPRWLLFLTIAGVTAIATEALWESMRPRQPSAFTLGLAHYGGIGLVAPWYLAPRLAAWWDEALRYVFVSPLLNLLLIVGAPVLLLARPPMRRADAVLALASGYLLLARTAISFQVWNRYMLPMVPLLCILLARLVDWLWSWGIGDRHPPPSPSQGDSRGEGSPSCSLCQLVSLALVAVLMLAPVQDALAGRVPVGSDHGTYWGIDETTSFLRANTPPGSVIFHYSLGWQFEYYLYGAPFDFWWYPSPEWLAQTAAARAGHSQYIVIPSWEETAEIDSALLEQGMALLPIYTAHRPDGSVSFQTYRIAPAQGRIAP